MNKKKILALMAAAAMLLSFTACNNNSTSSEGTESTSQTTSDGTAAVEGSVLTADIPADKVIAEIKDHPEMNVTFGEFIKEYKYYLASYGITNDTDPMYASTFQSRREYIVNYLINEEVMRKKFEELGLSLSAEDEAQIDTDTATGIESIKTTLKTQISATLAEGETLTDEELTQRAEEGFNNLLTSCGLTPDDFRNWQKSIVMQEKLSDHVNKDFTYERSEAEKEVEKLIENAKTSYAEDKSTYNTDTMSAFWIPEGSRYIKHILLKFDDDAVTEISTLRSEGKDAEADKLRDEKLAEMADKISEVEAKVAAGEDFDALMKEYSGDGDTTMSYLIVPGTTRYMDGFAETALAIPELGGTDVCDTDYGHHIIKYTEVAEVKDEDRKTYTDGLYQYLKEAYISRNFSDAMVEWRESYSFEIDRETLLLAEEDASAEQ